MSIWLADVNGQIVQAIVKRSFPEFLRRVFILDIYYIIDVWSDVIRDTFLFCQLSYGIFLKATCNGL